MFTIKIIKENGYEAYSCDGYRLSHEQWDTGKKFVALHLKPKAPCPGFDIEVYKPDVIYIENAQGKTIDTIRIK